MYIQRIAVVTGANRGIGLAIVRSLLKQSKCIVYLTARNQRRGEEAVKSLNCEGLHPQFHVLDTSNQKSILTLKEYIMDRYGGVDVFVHNAGIMYQKKDPTPLAERTRMTVSANYFDTVNVCNHFLPVIKCEGRIVMLSGVLCMSSLRGCSKQVQSFFKSPDLTEEKLNAKMSEFVNAVQTGDYKQMGFHVDAYGMSKLGVNAFTRILGKRTQQLKSKNILVNCCCPGWVKTDLGGPNAPLTPNQGAENPVMLALLPAGSSEPNGEYIQSKKVIRWY